jgi:hypothetical protein
MTALCCELEYAIENCAQARIGSKGVFILITHAMLDEAWQTISIGPGATEGKSSSQQAIDASSANVTAGWVLVVKRVL